MIVLASVPLDLFERLGHVSTWTRTTRWDNMITVTRGDVTYWKEVKRIETAAMSNLRYVRIRCTDEIVRRPEDETLGSVVARVPTSFEWDINYWFRSSIFSIRAPFYVSAAAPRLVVRLADLQKTARQLSIICLLLSRDRERSSRDVPSVVPLIPDSISSHSAPLSLARVSRLTTRVDSRRGLASRHVSPSRARASSLELESGTSRVRWG